MNGDNNGRGWSSIWLAVLAVLVVVELAALVRIDLSVSRLTAAQEASTVRVTEMVSSLAARVSALEVTERETRTTVDKHIEKDEVSGPGMRR